MSDVFFTTAQTTLTASGAGGSRLLANILLKCKQYHSVKRVLFAASDSHGGHDPLQLNLVLVLLFDMLFGCIVFWILIEKFVLIQNVLIKIKTDVTVKWYEELIVWLMGWPAGFKLNKNLNRFFGEMFLWMLGLWATFFYSIVPYDHLFIFLSTSAGFVGLSTLCAIFSDMIYVLTMHLHFMFFVSSRILRFMTFSLVALFQLFRGRKWNTLRRRYDFAHYNTGQLLAGTLLFVVLTFLFPTVLVYWVSFLISVRGIGLLRRLLLVTEGAVLHFPYFEVFLRCKNSFWHLFWILSGRRKAPKDIFFTSAFAASSSGGVGDSVTFVSVSSSLPKIALLLPKNRLDAYFVIRSQNKPLKSLFEAYVSSCLNTSLTLDFNSDSHSALQTSKAFD